jgi:Fe-S-cluster containining protein
MLELPPIVCERCGRCCGPVPCTEVEYQAVLAYAREHRVVPVRQELTCPFWCATGCTVYPVRPLLCQLMGHTRGLECSRGHNVNLSEKQAERLMRKYKKKPAPRFLHDVCHLRGELAAQLPGLVEE